MTSKEILKQLKDFGDPNTKKTLMNHGAKEPFFGGMAQFITTVMG